MSPLTLIVSHRRLCRKSVHGSTGSPRTDHGTLEINYLAVRPERVEGRPENYDTVSRGRGGYGRNFSFRILWALALRCLVDSIGFQGLDEGIDFVSCVNF